MCIAQRDNGVILHYACMSKYSVALNVRILFVMDWPPVINIFSRDRCGISHLCTPNLRINVMNLFIQSFLVEYILVKIHLTHWGLMTPYGGRDLGQHWLGWWLVAWRHLAITWTNVDLFSIRSSDMHLRALSHLIPLPPFTKISFHYPRVNELIKHTHALSAHNSIWQ